MSYTELDTEIDAAVNRWTVSDLYDTAMLDVLDEVDFVIADLSGDTLALTVGNTILIDTDAAGRGWYVDQTPFQDSEFVPMGSNSILTAQLICSILLHYCILKPCPFHETKDKDAQEKSKEINR